MVLLVHTFGAMLLVQVRTAAAAVTIILALTVINPHHPLLEITTSYCELAFSGDCYVDSIFSVMIPSGMVNSVNTRTHVALVPKPVNLDSM